MLQKRHKRIKAGAVKTIEPETNIAVGPSAPPIMPTLPVGAFKLKQAAIAIRTKAKMRINARLMKNIILNNFFI